MPDSVSIAIITRDRAKSLKRLLDSLGKQTQNPDEIIVVDNCSSDNTEEIVRNFKHTLPIRYILEKKVGIPYARNRALKEAKGGVLAFIDDDCEAPVSWVENIAKAYKKYPKTAAIQGKTISLPANKIIPHIVQALHDTWVLSAKHKNGLTICDSKNLVLNLSIIKTNNISFDEEFLKGSDVDLAKQIIHKQLAIIFYPQLVNYHYERESLKDFLRQVYIQGKSSYSHLYKWSETYLPEIKIDPIKYHKLLEAQLKASLLNKIIIDIILYLQKKVFQKGWEFQKKNQSVTNTIILRPKAINISVAIITKDRSILLRECLKSLVLQTLYPKEVIIVDNGSADGTKVMVSEFRKILPIKYILEKKVGIPYARNRALKEAKGGVLAFIDDDCEASGNWVESIAKVHNKNPKTAAVQGECNISGGNTIGIVTSMMSESWIQGNRFQKNRIITLVTMNASFKRKTLLRNKIFFDTEFLRGEDTDIGYQLTAKNLKIIYSPEIKIFYRPRSDLLSFLKQQFNTGKFRAHINYKWSFILKRRILSNESTFRNIGVLKSQILVPLVIFIRRRIYLMGVYSQMYKLLKDPAKRQRPNISFAPHKQNLKVRTSVIVWMQEFSSNKLTNLVDQLNQQTIQPIEIMVCLPEEQRNKLPKILDQSGSSILISFVDKSNPYEFIFRNCSLFAGEVIALINDDCEIPSDWLEKTQQNHQGFTGVGVIHGRVIVKNNSAMDQFEQYISDEPYYDFFKLRTRKYQFINVSFKKNFIENIKFKNGYLSSIQKLEYFYELLTCELECYHYNSSLYIHDIVCFYDNRNISLWSFFLGRFSEKASLYKLNLIKQELGLESEKVSSFLANKASLNLIYLVNLINQAGFLRKLIFIFLKVLDLAALLLSFFIVKSYQNFTEIKLRKFNKKRVPIVEYMSIAVITRNRSSSLLLLLKSLLTQSIFPKRIIIVDNGSVDDTKKIIKQFEKNLPIQYVYENKIGVSFARNRVLDLVSQGVLAFVDDDCLVGYNWVEKIINSHQKYESAAAIQGECVSYPSEELYGFVGQYYHDLLFRSWSSNLKEGQNYIQESNKRAIYLNGLDTKNVSFKVKKLKDLKLSFDQSLKRSEDYDMARNLLIRGERIILDPEIRIYHKERSDLVSLLKQAFLRGKTWVIVKHKWKEIKDVEFNSFNLELYKDFLKYCLTGNKSRNNIGLYIFAFFLLNLSRDFGVFWSFFKNDFKKFPLLKPKKALESNF